MGENKLDVLSFRDAKLLTEVRLVTESGSEIISGINAFRQAESSDLDLVMVGPDGAPPVVKILNSNKVKFEKKKALREQKRNSKSKVFDLKEIQFKANIADGDLKIKTGKIDKFLQKGHKVKIAVRFKGRERYVEGLGDKIIQKVLEAVSAPHKVIPQNSPQPLVILEPVKAQS